MRETLIAKVYEARRSSSVRLKQVLRFGRSRCRPREFYEDITSRVWITLQLLSIRDSSLTLTLEREKAEAAEAALPTPSDHLQSSLKNVGGLSARRVERVMLVRGLYAANESIFAATARIHLHLRRGT